MIGKWTLALGAAVLLSAPALAQDANGGPDRMVNWVAVEDDSVDVGPFGLPIDELEDMEVYGPDDEKIGEVEELLASLDGQPGAVAVELDKGLFDSPEVIVPLSRLERTGTLLTTDLTQEEIDGLPLWED